MSKQEIEIQKNFVTELESTKELCRKLMEAPHYKKMGDEGVFAVVETAKSLGLDPRQALGGGLYYVKGKVEMSSRMMNALIRSKKHSITRDKKSDDTICILHGKRADNGDTWTESFSIQEASKAGLSNSAVWKAYARDMLFARALSRLARQLFPDVIGNCYVEGEISLDSNIIEGISVAVAETVVEENVEEIKKPECPSHKREHMMGLLNQIPDYKSDMVEFLSRKGITEMSNVPEEMCDKIISNATRRLKEKQQEPIECLAGDTHEEIW